MANETVFLYQNPGTRLGDVSSNVLDDIVDVFGSRRERLEGIMVARERDQAEEKDGFDPTLVGTQTGIVMPVPGDSTLTGTQTGIVLPEPKKSVKTSKSKERKYQLPTQKWVEQVDKLATDEMHRIVPSSKRTFLVRCAWPQCSVLSQVANSFKKDGPFFCEEHYGAMGAPQPVGPPTVVNTAVVKAGDATPLPEPPSANKVLGPPPMYIDTDYYEQVIPCATALPRKLDYYLACVDFLTAVQDVTPNLHGCCIFTMRYLPCVVVSEMVLPNGFNQVSAYCASEIYPRFGNLFAWCGGLVKPMWEKCVNVCIYDEPLCIPQHRAPRRHQQVRYDTSQSYLSPEFSLNAKSAIVIKHCLRDLFEFYSERFVAQRFGSDDECRRALREAADDFYGKESIEVSIRDAVYNDTIMHFIWHKRQAANARVFVLGGAKASPDHINLG